MAIGLPPEKYAPESARARAGNCKGRLHRKHWMKMALVHRVCSRKGTPMEPQLAPLHHPIRFLVSNGIWQGIVSNMYNIYMHI
jgi:hypothetical protein